MAKELSENQMLICNAQVVWVASDFYPENEKYILVDTLKECFCTQMSLTELTRQLFKNYFLNNTSNLERIYTPPRDKYLEWGDGYFGRPKIPIRLWQFSPLFSNQIAELETHLLQLEEKTIT